MYERVPADQVLRAALVLEQAWRARGCHGVLVYAGRGLRGRMWKHPGAYVDGATFVGLSETVEVLRARLGVGFAVFGDLVLEQAHGLPIGGPLSDLGASLSLSMQEAAWATLAPLRRADGWGCLADSAACAAHVGQVRYVDDMLTMSRSPCEGCVSGLVQSQHPGIPFCLEERSSAGPVRWLGLLIHGARWPPHICMSTPERAWLTDPLSAPVKFRIAPFLGLEHVEWPRLRSHIRGLLAR